MGRGCSNRHLPNPDHSGPMARDEPCTPPLTWRRIAKGEPFTVSNVEPLQVAQNKDPRRLPADFAHYQNLI